MRFDAFLTEK